jgi:hypothetical protein
MIGKVNLPEDSITRQPRGISSVVTLYAIKDLKGDERAEILSKT